MANLLDLTSLIMESPRLSCTNGWGFVPNAEDTALGWMLLLAGSELAERLDTASFSNLHREDEISFRDLGCLALAEGKCSASSCDGLVSGGKSLLSGMSNPFAGRSGEPPMKTDSSQSDQDVPGKGERSSPPELEIYSQAGDPPARAVGGSV